MRFVMTAEYKNRDPELETSGKIVGFYDREFYCFSNFASFAVMWKGKLWPTSEHAYQAAHFLETDQSLVNKIHRAMSADEARKMAKANADKFPENWDETKVGIMEDVCRNKLYQNPYVMHKLLQTGDREIVEDSPYDSFWGWGPDRKGRNELGKIWMRLREEIIASE